MTRSWMKFYYSDPHPERFVEEVRQLSSEGALASQQAMPVITFLSLVMAANPNQIRRWLIALNDLPESDLYALEFAAWLSNAPEAKAYLAERNSDSLFAEIPPNMLEREIDDALMLDVLWCYYFATGEPRAVRRIISVLDYMSDYGAAARFQETAQTEEDKARALRDGMFQAAAWSLENLMQEHPPLKELCALLVGDKDLTPTERCALAISLSKIDPKHWHVDINPETGKATISRKH